MARTSGTKTREQMLQMGFNVMPPEQVREFKSLGGKVAQTRKRQKKLMLNISQELLALKLQNEEEIIDTLKAGGVEDQDISYATGIVLVQVLKALRGDTRAAEFVRDTSGQKPAAILEVGDKKDVTASSENYSNLNDDRLRELLET